MKRLLITALITLSNLADHDASGPRDSVLMLAGKSNLSAEALISAGNALMQRSRESADLSLFEKAESAYEQALKNEPGNIDAMIGLAWVHNSLHEFPEGSHWAKKAIAAGAKDHMAYSLLGDAAVELGQYDEALEYYQQGMDRSANLSTFSRSAHLLWLTGDATRAQVLMRKAIDAGGPHPENAAWCRAELALMLFQNGALLAAEQEIDRALKSTPENHHVLYVAGRIKSAKGEYANAIELLRKSIERNHGHGNHDALVLLGDLHDLTGQKDQAKRTYDQVAVLHSHTHSHEGGESHSHPAAHGNAQLARFYADHDRELSEALREAELAYRTYPNVFVTTTLAWCYYKNGLYGDAKRTIAKAMAMGTPDAAIYFRAGMIAAKSGDRAAAQKHLARALSLNPQFHPREASAAAEMLASLSRPAASRGPKGPSSPAIRSSP
jgi:tetratricopeptide (TPR) repeat protein